MGESENALPHWDMSVVYPGLASAEFEEGFRSTVQAAKQLGTLLINVGSKGRRPSPLIAPPSTLSIE
jgi:hypothetical protein